LRSVRNGGFKFIEAPRPELYDLQADPGERTNKYEAAAAHIRESRTMLAEIRAKENSQGDASITPSLPDPKDKIEQQNLLHLAMMASEDDRPRDARTALEKVLALDPKSPTALRQLGELELQAGNYAQASQHLKTAMEVRPDDATASFYAGQAMAKAHDLTGARDMLETSLKLMPGQFPARLLLGQVYLDLKDPKAAEDQFEAALLLQSDSIEAQLGVANAQVAQGNFAAAVESLEALSKSQPRNKTIFALLAQAYSGLGKSAEAQRAVARSKLLNDQK
jgi:predicted Zn-dependent protease